MPGIKKDYNPLLLHRGPDRPVGDRAMLRAVDRPWEDAKSRKLPARSDRHPDISPLPANDRFYNEDGVRGAAEVVREDLQEDLGIDRGGLARAGTPINGSSRFDWSGLKCGGSRLKRRRGRFVLAVRPNCDTRDS